MNTRPAPLHNVRVLDLTRLLPGPLATQHLADMGADVIKIEAPGEGDGARRFGAETDGEDAPLFKLSNRNKRSIQLDLKHAHGRDVFLKLVESADVLVEGFRPGVMAKLSLGYDELRDMHRQLVYCAITGYGQTGPYKDQAGHDLNYCALAGITDQIASTDGQPAIPNLQIADLLGGTMSAVAGILAALLDARESGIGRFVDIAMADCALAHNIFPMIATQQFGKPKPGGTDILSGALPCYRLYETSDGRHMALGALEIKFWKVFVTAVDRLHLLDKHWAEGKEAKETITELTALFKARTQAEWITYFEPFDCCISPVLRTDEAISHPHFISREMFYNVSSDNSETNISISLPIKFSNFEFDKSRPPPKRGEHNKEILREMNSGAQNNSKPGTQ